LKTKPHLIGLLLFIILIPISSVKAEEQGTITTITTTSSDPIYGMKTRTYAVNPKLDIGISTTATTTASAISTTATTTIGGNIITLDWVQLAACITFIAGFYAILRTIYNDLKNWRNKSKPYPGLGTRDPLPNP
jgi:hypothetical protein